MENKSLIKYRWFWPGQDRKAEDWLHQMSLEGWHLRSIGFNKYTFMKGEADIIILDEVGIAIEHSLINVDDVLEILDTKRKEVEVVLTGAIMHPKLLERADLITEMRLVKHPFSTQGIGPRRGIEY